MTSAKSKPRPGIADILKAPGLRDLLVLRFNLALQIVNERAERFTFEHFDIPMRQYWIMAAALDGKRSQLALADMLGVDPNVMVVHIDALERRGLVRRKANPKDRRERLIVLTAKGAAMIRRGIRIQAKAHRGIFVGVPDKEIKKACAIAEHILVAAAPRKC